MDASDHYDSDRYRVATLYLMQKHHMSEEELAAHIETTRRDLNLYLNHGDSSQRPLPLTTLNKIREVFDAKNCADFYAMAEAVAQDAYNPSKVRKAINHLLISTGESRTDLAQATHINKFNLANFLNTKNPHDHAISYAMICNIAAHFGASNMSELEALGDKAAREYPYDPVKLGKAIKTLLYLHGMTTATLAEQMGWPAPSLQAFLSKTKPKPHAISVQRLHMICAHFGAENFAELYALAGMPLPAQDNGVGAVVGSLLNAPAQRIGTIRESIGRDGPPAVG